MKGGWRPSEFVNWWLLCHRWTHSINVTKRFIFRICDRFCLQRGKWTYNSDTKPFGTIQWFFMVGNLRNFISSYFNYIDAEKTTKKVATFLYWWSSESHPSPKHVGFDIRTFDWKSTNCKWSIDRNICAVSDIVLDYPMVYNTKLVRGSPI